MRKDRKLMIPTVIFIASLFVTVVGGIIERGYFAITLEPFLMLVYLGYVCYVKKQSEDRKLRSRHEARIVKKEIEKIS